MKLSINTLLGFLIIFSQNQPATSKADEILNKNGAQDLLLPGTANRFNDVEATIIDLETKEKFESQLAYSVLHWQEEGYKSIWFTLPVKCAEYLESLLSHNFKIHHATAEHLVLTRWLKKDSEDILPPLIPCHIAIAALVIDEENNVLAVKERYGTEFGFRLPGGGINQSEHLWQAAQREVREETGIDTEFCSIVGFTHGNFPFTMEIVSKAYFCCLLRPLTKNIVKKESEIADARWIPYEEFKQKAKGVFADFIAAYEACVHSVVFKTDDTRSTVLYSAFPT